MDDETITINEPLTPERRQELFQQALGTYTTIILPPRYKAPE